MARYLYGGSPADFTVNSRGHILPNVSVTVWTAMTGGTQVTDLTDLTGTPISTVTSDDSGSIRFYGPDGFDGPLWLQGSGARLLIRPSSSSLITTVTAKGDLLVATSDHDLENVPVGTDGQVLIAASGQTAGVKWGQIGSGSITDGAIVDDDINAAADIAPTKIAGTAITAADTGTITPGLIADGAITQAKIDPQVLMPWRFTGFDVTDRDKATDRTTVTLPKDKVIGRIFRAPADMAVTGMSMQSGGTAAVDLTYCQYGLYHVGDHTSSGTHRKSFTLLARSASDTAMFTAPDTVYTKAFDTTGGYPSVVVLRRGEWYMAAVSLTGTTMPTVVANAYQRPQLAAVQPIMGGEVAGMGTFGSYLWPYWAGGSWNYNGAGAAPWRHLTVDPESVAPAARPTVLLGDSFFASYAGWFSWGNAQSGSLLVPVMNAGEGGERLDQIVARISTDVAPYFPEVVVLHGGTNDVNNSASAATIKSRFLAIFDALDALGVTDIVACTIPSQTDFTAGEKAIVLEVNTWLNGLTRAGLTVADTQLVLTTGDGVTSDAAKLVDTVHPNYTGLQAMADVLDDVLAAL